MLREGGIEEVPRRIAEVASAIAEEGLRYVNDATPGYRRKRTATSFTYYDEDGKPITYKPIVRRIKSIGIPPAYESVWICPGANGHIQATGLDARGRKQYRYHPKWRELRDQHKYAHMVQFAAALPSLRARVASDIKLDGMPRNKVLATIVSLLEKTLIRVGSAEYAEQNKSYGLTTMRRKHVVIGRGVLRFDFTGKSGKQWRLRIEDKRIASVVKRCAEIPAHEFFKYLDDDGASRTGDSGDVTRTSARLQDRTSPPRIFGPGPGRHWRRSRSRNSRSTTDRRRPSATSLPPSRRSQSSLVIHPPSAAKSYVHPEVLATYMSGEFVSLIGTKIAQKFKRHYAQLTADEIMALASLHKRLETLKSPRKLAQTAAVNIIGDSKRVDRGALTYEADERRTGFEA